MSEKLINHVMVVSHTHWDPEWYSTFEEYRIRLVDLMEKLFYTLEDVPDFHSFMFDGQVAPLESYLAIFPENKERIEALVKTGRLLVGPWFVMPDEYMSGPEAHIHNLLLGTRIAGSWGQVMKLGYLPDIAGHISQMPQILNGFGINSAVVWRGVAGYPETAKTEFTWRGSDGTEILAIHLPWAYGNHNRLFSDTEFTSLKIQELIERQKSRNATCFMLLMSGGDHQEPHPLTPNIIKDINDRNLGFRLEHVNILQYIEKVNKELRNPGVHVGEMRRTETSFLLSGVQSTRMPLKEEHIRTEVLLEKWVEPLCTNSMLIGNKYPERLIWAAWRYFLQNTFHDVIYGAHVDEVTADALNRYKRAQEIGNWLAAIASYNIANTIDTAKWYRALVVFNTDSLDRNEVGEFTIDFFKKDDVKAFRITNEKGREVPFQIITCKEFDKYESERNIMDGFPSSLDEVEEQKIGEPVCRYRLALLAENVPALGYRAYRVEPIPRRRKPVFLSKVKVSPNRTLENDFIRVKIGSGGIFTMIDKTTREIYRNCNFLEDGGDVGDNYTYQPPVSDHLITSSGAEDTYTVLENGPLRATAKVDVIFPLPISATPNNESRTRKKIRCPLSIYISIDAISPYVNVRVEFNNQARDHRLRVAFYPEISTHKVYLDGHFDILARDVNPLVGEGWMEKPSPTQPQRNFVTLRGKERGLAIFNKGLVQYEATNTQQPILYITLLRCTGYLSKEGLEERNGLIAGPGLPTPGAQCLGHHAFEYAVYPYDPSTTSLSDLHLLGEQFVSPLRAIDIAGKGGTLPKELSFCRVKGALASAYKKAEVDDDIILRVYNISDHLSQAEVEFFNPMKSITEVALSEVPVTQPLPLRVSHNKAVLSVPAKKIVTLKISSDTRKMS